MHTEDVLATTTIDDTLSKLHISHPPITIQDTEPNPWQDTAPEDVKTTDNDDNIRHNTDAAPDVSILDPATAGGLAAEPESPPPPPPVKEDILQEFDPLVSQEEKAAKEAWESSESHPPLPVPDEPPQPPPVPAKNIPEEPARPSSPLPTFSSLAALARTFALPLTGPSRQRPRSLDTATAVPSPATLSSFANQQQLPRTPTPSGSGRSTPTTKPRKDDEPPQFDFQKFLDQMKTRGAEPVAKYLRS